jgi:hypothetical protein
VGFLRCGWSMWCAVGGPGTPCRGFDLHCFRSTLLETLRLSPLPLRQPTSTSAAAKERPTSLVATTKVKLSLQIPSPQQPKTCIPNIAEDSKRILQDAPSYVLQASTAADELRQRRRELQKLTTYRVVVLGYLSILPHMPSIVSQQTRLHRFHIRADMPCCPCRNWSPAGSAPGP